jgi:hypothetical protein
VATAALSPADIASPLRSILRDARNVAVLLAEVERVDLTGRRILLEDGELAYDALILATGASHSYFGHEDWELLAPGLKTLEDALEIRRRVLLAYEAAERCLDGAERRALLTFVVIGGGPTGVELSGALAEIARQSMARDFRVIDPEPGPDRPPRGRAARPACLRERSRRRRRRRSRAAVSRCAPARWSRASRPTPCGSAAIRSAAAPCSGRRGRGVAARADPSASPWIAPAACRSSRISRCPAIPMSS